MVTVIFIYFFRCLYFCNEQYSRWQVCVPHNCTIRFEAIFASRPDSDDLALLVLCCEIDIQ